ncbi:CoA transferase (plasmid) [Rhodococcus sp. USK10]|uniref:CaiB/BaiF CoA transferase family protein n=1 Tax=Rhodococcus sp. USK10 TaxID=2789739 RepID=UPI001C5E3A40|nr:CoA transferase [Rhodococcus sp. USK10]QYB00334.1 CoA transferase [Rhodococcus sp. USK10]
MSTTDRPSANSKPGPLDGLRVIDLSTVFAVPYIAGLLGDFGADVIKVESPDRLEQTRGVVFGPLLDNEADDSPWDRSGSFGVLNRNKRSTAVDMKTPEGRELLWRLVGDADVLLDNFTPRVLPSWGFTHEALVAANPSLIHLSNTGFGSTGPWSSFKAQGTTLESTMGVGAYSGYAGEPPSKVGQSYPDFLAAWTGLTALMAALVERRRTGEGQWIDLGMYQLGPAVIPEALARAQTQGGDYGRRGNHEIHAEFSQVFASAQSERWIAVSIRPGQWDAVAAALPGISHDAERENALALVLATFDAEDAAASLRHCGVSAAVVSDAHDLMLDPQLRHRRFFEPLPAADDRSMRPVIGRPYRWTADTAVTTRYRAPHFGEHNSEVLSEIGVDQAAQTDLRDRGAVADTPRNPPPVVPVNIELNLARGIFSSIDPDFMSVLATMTSDDNTQKA